MRWLRHSLVVSILCLPTISVLAGNSPQLLLVDARVNYISRGEIIMLWDGEDNFWATGSDLRAWRVENLPPASLTRNGKEFHALDRIPGLRANYNSRQVAIDIFIPGQLLDTYTSNIGEAIAPDPTAANGLYVDYDAAWVDESSDSYATALITPTVFGTAGVLHGEFAYRDAGAISSGDAGIEEFLRLETTFSRDDPAKLRSYRGGDVLSADGPWSGPYRIGGVQIVSNFSTQPSLITFPVPTLDGTAQVPSSVDLYVNGVLRYREDLEPGKFRVEGLPVVTGDGELTMVVTDILGREQIVTQNFYASSSLLRPGLSEYSYTAGLLRENYGYQSNDYDGAAFVGMHRLGISDQLTLGGRMEVSDAGQLVAGSVDWGRGEGGVVTTSLALSNADAGLGGAFQFGYQYDSRPFRIRTELIATTPRLATIDDENAGVRPNIQFVLNGGWDQGFPGSIGATLIRQVYRDRDDRNVLTVNYNRRFGRELFMSLYTSLIDADESDYIVGMSFNRSFGFRRSANTTATTESGEQRVRVETQYSPPVGPGFGYRVGTTLAERDRFDGSLIGQTTTGRYLLDAQSYDGVFSWRANAQGSVAWMAGRPYLAREISDGFAVAKVGTFENVRVYLENHEIGRSDSKGRLLLPSLRPYETNRVRIEPADLPLGAQVESLSAEVAPYFRAGTVVEFPVSMTRQAVMYVRLPDGSPVPEGSTVVVDGADKRLFAGLEGMIYITGIESAGRATVRWPDAECAFEFPMPDSEDALPNLGNLLCEPAQ